MTLKRIAVALALAASSAAGCTSYYAVRDPATGNRYYTTDVDRAGHGGAVRFRDAATDSYVTIPSSEVREISRSEFRRGVNGR